MSDSRETAAQAAAPTPATRLDLALVRARQNLPLAIAAGVGAAVVGAIIWAVFVYVTHMKLGLVVIGIGFLVGFAVRSAGQGVDKVFGYLGAACSALGWALGTVLCTLAFVAKSAGEPMTTVLARLGPGELVAAAFRASDFMDLVFLAIAIWEGYRFSLRFTVKKR
jgi:hypothetical protein